MPNNRIVFTVTLGELAEVPGTPFAYWAPKSLRDLFQKFPSLDRDVAHQPDKPKIADVKTGLGTGKQPHDENALRQKLEAAILLSDLVRGASELANRFVGVLPSEPKRFVAVELARSWKQLWREGAAHWGHR